LNYNQINDIFIQSLRTKKMTTLKEIENAVSNLSEERLSEFRAWFIEFNNQMWDEKLKKDINSGKLDNMVSEALNDYSTGKCEPL